MLPGDERGEMREVFFRAWHNFRQKQPLAGIEKIAVDVALRHPEYHAVLDDPQSFRDQDYSSDLGESNPFLHMGLHIAIEEQITSNRPPGIVDIYKTLRGHFDDSHKVEHQMMDCLAQTLWQAQQDGSEPSQAAYLACLQRQAGAR